MRLRWIFSATRALTAGMIVLQSALDLAQVLPRMFQRATKTAAGRPPLFAALDLRGADLRCDSFELGVEKLPEVRKPGRESVRFGASDRLQRVLHAFRLADAGGAEVLGLRVRDVSNGVAEHATLRRLFGELMFRDPADERDDLLAEPLEATTVDALVFRTQRFEVGREARSRIALADPRSLHDVRRDLRSEGRVRVRLLAMALEEAKELADLARCGFERCFRGRPVRDAAEQVEHVDHRRLHLRPGLEIEPVLRHSRTSPSTTVTAWPPISARPRTSNTCTDTCPSRPISVACVAT